jgi:TP901 family phage tail tape measure protein
MAAEDIGSLVVRIEANLKNFNDGIQDVGKKVDGFGSTVKKIGGIIAGAFAVKAIVDFGKTAINMATDFEKGMANVATLLDGDVNTRITELGENIKSLQKTTGTSAAILQDGLYQVISAFGDTADSMNILETASKGAAAGNATVTDSVNLLSAVTKGYGDTSAESAQKASDLAFLTVKLGQTTFPELAASMGKVIPLASTLGVKQEELFGAAATLTGVTGNTAEVMTQLRGTMQGFLQPTDAMTQALSKLGYANGMTALESQGLNGILQKLLASVDGDQIAFANLFGSIEAKNAVLALVGTQADNFTQKTKAMTEAVGATDDAFKKQQNTFSATIARLKETASVIITNIGTKALPILTNMANFIINNFPQMQMFAKNVFDEISNAISPIYETVIPLLRQGFQEFSDTILPMFSEKISGISQSILPLIMDALKNLAETILPPLKTMFEVFINDVLPKLADAYMSFVTNVYPIIVDAFNYIVNTVLPPLIKVFEYIATEIVPLLAAKFQEWIPIIVDIFKGLWDAIKIVLEVIVAAFNFAWPTIRDTVTNVVNVITGVVKALLKILRGLIDFVIGVFTGDWERAWKGIKGIFEGIWEGFQVVIKGALNALITMINSMIRGINKINIKVPDWVANLVGLAKGSTFGFNIKEIPMLKKGTNFVPFDTMAFLHQGEAVVPATNNPSNPNATNPFANNISFENMVTGNTFVIRSDNDIKTLAREFYNLTQSKNRGSGIVAI